MLPGLRGIEHVGITVPDLEAAVAFFTGVLGCTRMFDGGASGRPDFMERSLAVPREATMRYAFLRCANGPNLEVFEYTAPDQATEPPRNSDVGGHHLCFYVDDIEAAVAHLASHGIETMGPVNTIAQGPAKGSSWVYFRAPWGLQLELVSFPAGKGDPDSPARGLWRPDGVPG